MSDNSKLLKLVQDKITYFDKYYEELIMTPIYEGPNDKLGVALAELAAYLEIAFCEKKQSYYTNINRRVTYNEELSYDNLDPSILDDYERFRSIFIYF